MQVFNLKQRQMILCASGEEGGDEPKRKFKEWNEDFAFIPGDASDMNSIA